LLLWESRFPAYGYYITLVPISTLISTKQALKKDIRF
jgi:hypothetical protein